MDGYEAGKIIPCCCWKCHNIQVSAAGLNRGEIYPDKVSAVQCASMVKHMLFPFCQSTLENSKITHLCPHFLQWGKLFMWRQGKAMCAKGKESTPSLSNHPNNPRKNHNVLDKMLHTFPNRKAHSVSGVWSTHLNTVPGNCTLVSNRRELPAHGHLGPPMNFFLVIPSLEKDAPVPSKNKGYISR